MTRILVTITTYNRPEMLTRLVEQLREQSDGYILDMLVFDDLSDTKLQLPKGVEMMHKLTDHQGVLGFWRLIDCVIESASASIYDYWIHLPDDVTLRPYFFKKATETWDGVKRADPMAVCLNPLKTGRKWRAQWTDFRPPPRCEVLSAGSIVWQIGWNDCCWITDRSLGNALDWRIHPVTHTHAGVSSGVGRQISRRLHARGFSMYGVAVTLLDHSDHPSVMHPQERLLNPLLT